MWNQRIYIQNPPVGDGLDHANQPNPDPLVILEPLLFIQNVDQWMLIQNHVLLVLHVVYIPALLITGHLVPLRDISQVQSVSSQSAFVGSILETCCR